ncbi:GAF domain-containing protein [Dactylosporangium sp. NPDC051485]|uniref:GAF domain-containing protein n=1 Tax=Dactylosporangium sp. NPDC051485 TaxID=3154846 RepID=UPI00342240B8
MIDVLGTEAAVRDPARLRAVAATGLPAAPHPWFDHLVARAGRALGVPVVLLVLIERYREILPGAVGLPELWQQRRETPLARSICQYVIGARARLAISDVRRDPVLHSSDAVRDLAAAAYAGIPVHGRDGHVVGALGAIDVRPRAWSIDELDLLDGFAARCARRLQLMSASAPPDPPPATPPPAAEPEPPPVPDRTLWTPRLPPGLVLDPRPRPGGPDITLAGRWHGEPVTVVIRAADDPAAVRRFDRRVAVAQAFRRDPPLVRADEYRWHDERTLVVARAAGEPLRPDPDPAQSSAVIRLAALLSTWRPDPPDAAAWTVDYPAWIARHERTGQLTADDARRLRVLLGRCGEDRTFAHGNLTPGSIVRLASGRLALTDFAAAGMYLAGFDLATLALAAPDTPSRPDIDDRVSDADIAEPFAVNLMLHAAETGATPSGATTPARLARRHAAIRGARRRAQLMMAHLGVA